MNAVAHVRRTGVVATVGPASSSPEVLSAMIAAGVDVFRISSAHDHLDVVVQRIGLVRAAAAVSGVDVAVMVDLCGPKLRFANCGDGVAVSTGQRWWLSASSPTVAAGNVLGASLPESVWPKLVPGTRIAVGDGAVSFTVLRPTDDGVEVRVDADGVLRGRPGLHVPSDLVELASPTVEDLRVLSQVADLVDMVAVSFVRDAKELEVVRARVGDVFVVAKIETAASVRNLDEIIGAADAVMVARGDLGLEFPPSELPFLQKRILAASAAACRPVITATQMLESMVVSAVPTRAEAADVVAAVLDGTSSVMLSGETAVGADPALAVATMSEIAARADVEFVPRTELAMVADSRSEQVTHAMSRSVCRIAEDIDAAAVVCLTERGFTARAISRWRPRRRMVAATRSALVARQLRLSWGVDAVVVDSDDVDVVLQLLVERFVLDPEVTVVVVSGEPGAMATDTVRVRRTPQMLVS